MTILKKGWGRFFVFALVGLLSSSAFAMTLQEFQRPVADRECQLSLQDRTDRIRFVKTELNRTYSELDRAVEAMNTHYESLRVVNVGYRVQSWSMIIGTLAGIAAGGSGLVLAAKAGDVLTLASTAVSSSITLGPKFYTLAKNSDRPGVGMLDFSLRKRLNTIVTQPLIFDSTRPFLSDPECTMQKCPVGRPDIEDLIGEIQEWYQDKKLQDQAAAMPWIIESFTLYYGKVLAETELPRAIHLVTLLSLKRNYYLSLLEILKHDQTGCGQ
ncbi:hypothetical protein WDW86_04370 [Bdellovibrionota bacterium FG-2]